MAKSGMQKFFQVQLKKSAIGCNRVQKEAVRCLGLRKIGSRKVFPDTPSIRGQILKVQHLLDIHVQGPHDMQKMKTLQTSDQQDV